MFAFDSTMQKNHAFVVGVDEAGRGPLAGPVVAAAVIFPTPFQESCQELQGLGDSKKLSESKRDYLYPQITRIALAYCIG